MRLGDLDALKKDIEENAIELGGVLAIEVECAKALIDNAPTVIVDSCGNGYKTAKEDFENHKLVNNSQELVKDLVKEKSERPHGEWVGNAFDEHHCNRCGHPALWEEEPDGYYEVQSRFCPNCGADMRGEE